MITQPLCPIFGECGGCHYQDIPYSEELERKEALVKDLLLKNSGITAEVFEPIIGSPQPYHYRNRLDLKFIRTRDQRVLLGFTPKSRRGIAPADHCAIAAPSISGHIPALKKHLEGDTALKYRRANIVIRTGEEPRVHWGGIGRRSCRLNPGDYFQTTLNGRKIFYSLDTFFQANLSILPKLFERLNDFDCWQTRPVLYDLYAGVGLFSLALADHVRKTFLIEESVPSLELARYNLDYHHLTNMEIIAGRMEDTLPPLLTREDPGMARVAIIDPPRAGLSPQALKTMIHTTEFTHLFYLSCNPQALTRDLGGFTTQGWQVQKIIPFDFFPKTRHVETLVLLTPKKINTVVAFPPPSNYSNSTS